jgi:hypothetical protein
VRLAATLLVAGFVTACSSPSHQDRAAGTAAPAPDPATTAGPLIAPETTTAQDSQYFEYLAEADPSLSTYVNTQGNVALQALLTDGAAFCGFLHRGGGIDNAMDSVVIGAKSVEAQTHLPSNITTFNAIDAVALITLCPADQKLIPSADQGKIQSLEKSLNGRSGSAVAAP